MEHRRGGEPCAVREDFERCAVGPAKFREWREIGVEQREEARLLSKLSLMIPENDYHAALHAQGNIAVIRLQPWVDGQDLVLRLL